MQHAMGFAKKNAMGFALLSDALVVCIYTRHCYE